ncbi:hypothetical protein LC607_22700 [Nostoc sp. CHAB 5824]|nr:hypothetical protein [Nostoc sp. CHAB 5824]
MIIIPASRFQPNKNIKHWQTILIKELKTAQEQYFDFPWKGVSIEATTEADKEEYPYILSSSIGEV